MACAQLTLSRREKSSGAAASIKEKSAAL